MGARASIFDEPGRYREARSSTSKASGRVGSKGRTMHARVTSITRANGGARRAGNTLDYDAREGRHKSRADELETEGGTDRKDMAKALQASEEATGRKNGVVARRIIAELPAEMDADARRAVAERVAVWFIEQGHPTHWAVHSRNGKGEYQPHLHMTVVARRCRLESDTWKAAPAGRSGVKGGGGEKPILAGPAALQYWRREVVAAAINTVAAECGIHLAAAWHGGRLAETGINRPAKRRRPEVAIRAPERARVDDRGLGAVNGAIDAGDEIGVRTARKAHVERRRQKSVEAVEAVRMAVAKRMVEAVETGKGRVPAAIVKPIRDAAMNWKKQAEKLREAIRAERTKPAVKPANEKQRTTAVELARRMAVELPEGWDVSAGSAGTAVRLLKALAAARIATKAAQEAAKGDQAARWTAESERDQARQEASEARKKTLKAQQEARKTRIDAAELEKLQVLPQLLDAALEHIMREAADVRHQATMGAAGRQIVGIIARATGRPNPLDQQQLKQNDQEHGR